MLLVPAEGGLLVPSPAIGWGDMFIGPRYLGSDLVIFGPKRLLSDHLEQNKPFQWPNGQLLEIHSNAHHPIQHLHVSNLEVISVGNFCCRCGAETKQV